MILHTASTFTSLPKHTGQQPAEHAHINHRTYGIGCDGAASCGAADKVIIAKSRKRAARSKQGRSQPSFRFFFHVARIIKTISKGVVLIISPFLEKLYCRSSYLLYNQNKHCGFVSHTLQRRLVGGDSNRSGLSELVISWVTLDVLFA